MYFLPLVFSLVLFLGRLVLSLLIPTDDLDFDPLLFDSTQSSPFLPEANDFLTTDATLSNPCAAAQDDLSLTQDGETNLFSREDHPQCLPPVSIGSDALHLFDSPLDSLERTLFPLNGETPNNPPPTEPYPERLLGVEEGDRGEKKMENQGWQPYTGSVGVETPDDSACKELTARLGTYNIELCCNAMSQSRDARGGLASSRMGQIDALTIANQDIAVIYECICTSLFVLPKDKSRGGGFLVSVRSFDTDIISIRQSPEPIGLVLCRTQCIVFVATFT